LSKGYRLDRVDKACLVFSCDSLEGYKVLVVDKTNGNAAEAQYWTDAFLELEAAEDSYHFTQQYMNLTKQFVREQLPEEFQVIPSEQIAMLNRGSKFFKENERFQMNDFAEQVMQAPEVAESFRICRKQYRNARRSQHHGSIRHQPASGKEAPRDVSKRIKTRQELPYLHPRKP
jgi:hypothetical protein